MRYVCLLRGVNVSGHRQLTMKELVSMCEELGLTNVASYLQSGNLIVSSKLAAEEIELLLETEIHRRFDIDQVDVMARSGPDIEAVVGGIPQSWKEYETSKLHFSFLKQPQTTARAVTSSYLPDEFALGERVVYVHCPGGYGRTKLNNSFFERLLDTRATTRNWNTATKLLEMVNA